MLCGLTIPLLWLFAIYIHHGWPAIDYLLFGQVKIRVGIILSVWYVPLLRMLEDLLPWTFIFLICLFGGKGKIKKNRLMLGVVIIMQLLFFGFFVKMQPAHYLIPLFPFAALCMADFLAERMIDKQLWIIAGLSLLGFTIYEIIATPKEHQSLQPIAEQIYAIQQTGASVAQFSFEPGYQNFGYLGRLNDDLSIITDFANQSEWLKNHPDGWIVKAYSKKPQNCHFSQQWNMGNQWTITLSTVQNYLACR
jgi:4-amino-4-deoxy-L-arabinose transferase-like glycosyltransferase